MANRYPKILFNSSLTDLVCERLYFDNNGAQMSGKNAQKKARKKPNTHIITMVMMLGTLMLTGCGQKGALYLPEEAPSNTDFMIYKGNKSEANKVKEAQTREQVEQAAEQDPEDY